MAFSDVKMGTETHVQANAVGGEHGSPEIAGANHTGRDGTVAVNGRAVTTIDELEATKRGRFAFYKSRNFYVVLILG